MPLLLTLKKQYYEDFESGRKRIEFRRYGRHFNERIYYPGREVELTYRRFGGARLKARVVRFWTEPARAHPAVMKFYGTLAPDDLVAMIELAVQSNTRAGASPKAAALSAVDSSGLNLKE